MKKLVLVAIILNCLAGIVLTCMAGEIDELELSKSAGNSNSQRQVQPAGSPGGQAIDFTLKNLAGNEVSLMKDFAKKKVIILVFSATWCSYCVQEIPALKALYNKYNYKGLEIIHIDPKESRDRVQKLVDKYKIPYPVLLDEKGEITGQYKILGIPTIIYLDQKRNIKWRSSGGEQDYEGRLQELGIK
ncbi:MAG: TlpA family protein disulfide reductase [bacterium]|nr:TlpA family protein disulfide reductase [bacterium]